MSGSLREEWEECCAERDRALADLARECVRVATLERANATIEEDRKREKARAEKAEVDLVAVRLACEGLRRAVSGLIAACEFGGGCDGSDPDTCDGCVAVNEAKAALAAPAAGVECPECNQPAPVDADGKIGPHRLGGAPCANGWPDRKEKSNG